MDEPILATVTAVLSSRRRRPPRRDLVRLSNDIRAVSLDLRSACLVDAVALDEDEAESISKGLDDVDGLKNLLLVFLEASSAQVFICSRRRLRETRVDEELAKRAWVDVAGSEPRAIPWPGTPLSRCLSSLLPTLATSDPPFVRLDLSTGVDDPPPLPAVAGFLLDYPVVYLTHPLKPDNALGGRPLHVVAVDVRSDSSDPHRLMQFSVPVELSEALRLDHVLSGLQADVSGRLVPPWTSVSVTVLETVTLDRVAL